MLYPQIGPHHDGCKSIENLLVCSNSVKQYNFSEECHLAMDLDQKSPFPFFCLAKLSSRKLWRLVGEEAAFGAG
jgi:hypothetical protein